MIKKIFNCISIHSGGGISYLSMMHSEIDKKGNLILIDYRAKNDLKPFLKAETKFIRKSIFRNLIVLNERIKYSILFRSYLKNKNKEEFFCEYYLNGIPPLFRFSIITNKVFVLLQNRNLFSYLNYFDGNLYFKSSFVIYHILHKILINLFMRNSDNLLVQTNVMKKIILEARPKNKIFVEDFYWKNITNTFYRNYLRQDNTNKNNFLLSKIKNIAQINTIFFYPASFNPHKNHKILFSSFENLSKNFSKKFSKNFKLMVTIDKKIMPYSLRENKNILFLGNQSFETIFDIYTLVDYLIFPSLNESLGLPLIEAELNNLPIIASDLDYVYEVCNPRITFNPYSEKDICEKIIGVLS